MKTETKKYNYGECCKKCSLSAEERDGSYAGASYTCWSCRELDAELHPEHYAEMERIAEARIDSLISEHF